MARISSYPTDSTIQDKDSWIGTESTNRVTRNFTAEDVANYVVTSTSGVTGSGTLNTIPLWTPDGAKLGDSIITQSASGQGLTITGQLDVTEDFNVSGSTELIGSLTVQGESSFNDDVTFESVANFKNAVYDQFSNQGTAGQVLSSTGTNVKWVDNTATGTVTGTGTTNILPIWTDGPNSVLGDSGITQTLNANNKITNITLATNGADPNSLSASFGTGGSVRFTTGAAGEFMRLTTEVDGFYKSRFRFQNKVTVDRDSSSVGPSLDVGDSNHTYAAAWFRNGVVLSNNPSGVQVDNTSMVIGAGNNDVVTGSDNCLAVGNNNQILSDSDNSLAVGQGNIIRNNSDNSFAIGQNNIIDGTAAAQSVKSQVLGFQNNLTGSFSSFIAGGQNTVTTNQNAVALGFSHILAGDDSMFAFGENNTGPSGANDNNSFMIGGNLTGVDGNMVLGFRNDASSYPTTDYSNGLGNTKFVVSVGTVTSSNAMIITEGGVTRGGGITQVPRIILPQQETLEFTSDADATTGGIPTGGLYRNGNDLKINFNETAAGGNEGLAYLTPQLLTASATGSGTVDPNYNLVLLSWTGGNGVYTLNLPLASANTNRLIRITTNGTLSSGAGDKIDITATGGDTIDGAASFQISKQYEGLAIYSTGSEWIIVQAKAH
tara:strand:- start:2318 stop:4294 length:1977 start_codon:yes stop_codon:yes gene_type:complete